MGLLWGKNPSKTHLIPAQTQMMRTAGWRTVVALCHATKNCFMMCTTKHSDASLAATDPAVSPLPSLSAEDWITSKRLSSSLLGLRCANAPVMTLTHDQGATDSALLSVHYIAVNCKSARARLLIWFQCPCTALLFQDYCCLWYRPTSCG